MDFYQEFKSEILKIPNLPWETDTNDTLSELKQDFENSTRNQNRHLTSLRKGGFLERGNSQLFNSKLEHSQSLLMPQKSMIEHGRDGGTDLAKKWSTAAKHFNEGDALLKQTLDGRDVNDHRTSILIEDQEEDRSDQLEEAGYQKEYQVARILGQYEKDDKAKRDVVVETLFKYRRGESLHYGDMCRLYKPNTSVLVDEVSEYNSRTLSSI